MTQSNIQMMEASTNRTFRNPLNIPIALIANRFGARSKEVERFLRFAVVGAVGAIIDLGTLSILQATLLPPVNLQKEPLVFNVALATTISFTLAVISNFIWTRLWVYPETRNDSFRKQLGQFAFLSVVGWLARTTWISLSYYALGPILMPIALPVIHWFRPAYVPSHTAEAKLGTLVAQMIGMVFVMFWNFFANRYWTYRHIK
jgi:putative flippase GtrA